MTCDELALLRAVLENPADDLPRLVFADWLDEHGGEVECRDLIHRRPDAEAIQGRYKCRSCSGSGRVSDGRRERAEFVRVQVELAKMSHMPAVRTRTEPPTPDDYDDELERWETLRRRERELWAFAYDSMAGFRWFDLFGRGQRLVKDGPEIWSDDNAQIKATVRRGFVEAVACPAAAWLEHGDAIHWHPSQTVECARCAGRGKETWTEAAGVLPYETHACRVCKGEKRIPRPCPPTAHPVVRVRLTTGLDLNQWASLTETGRVHHTELTNEFAMGLLSKRWPGVTFELPEPARV